MRLPVLPKTTLFLLTFFTSTALSQGPENRGDGVIDPKLTGTREGYRADQVNYWAPNDPSYVRSDLFQQQMLDVHNRYRREHGVAPVAWDPLLVQSSQKHVDVCVYEHSKEVFSPTTTYGENIYFGYETVVSGVERWGDERIDYASGGYYDSGAEPPHELLHFTQMVWRTTNTIGCARKKCIADQLGNGNVQESWFVCCHYYNRGNVQGQYKANVFRQRG